MGRETFVWYPPVYAYVEPVYTPQVYAYAPVMPARGKIYGPYGPYTYGPY